MFKPGEEKRRNLTIAQLLMIKERLEIVASDCGSIRIAADAKEIATEVSQLIERVRKGGS